MRQRHWFGWCWQNVWVGGLLGWMSAFGAAVSVTFAFTSPIQAQSNILPDNTLGAESSIVIPNVQELPTEVITGGAVRGANLFHSFQEFNVSAGRFAYFLPNANIQNILARVTGSNRSEILGTLGTIGNSAPNLFLINPNGIIFGENASLNVGGSFVGSTANAIQFGTQGIFSASTPQAPGQLLTINPSALLFNQLSTAAITYRSVPDPARVEVTGLRVPDGRSLLLVGGNVNVDGGSLRAYEGRIELAGLASRGTVGLNVAGNILSLGIPEGVERADVSLTNGAVVNVRAAGGGSIAINARNFNLAGGSRLRSGIESFLSASSGNAGDIEINATGETTLTDGSIIANVVEPKAVGNAGNINITTGALTLRNRAELNSSTFGSGDSGSVFVQASGMVSVGNSNIFSSVVDGAVGNSGGIFITSRSLGLTDGAQLQSNTFGSDASLAGGRGSAIGVNINVRDRVTLAGVNQNGASAIFTNIQAGAVGKGGDININAGSLSLADGAELSASTSGFGDAGSISVRATDSVSLANGNFFSSRVLPSAVGNGGNIDIFTGSLSLTDGARLITSTSGQGDAGSILIQVRDAVSLAGRGTTIFSTVERGSVGNGGMINIQAGEFSLTDGAQLQTSLRGASGTLPGGRGNAGNVNIRVSDRITLAGFSSGIFTDVESGAVGNGGDINILTGAFFLTNAAVSGSTSGVGDAGSISVQATDSVSLANSNIFSGVSSPSAVGNGGNIDIHARALSLTNGSLVFTGSAGQGNGGSISVLSSESVSLINSNIISSVSSVSGVTAVGNGGNIHINALKLSLNDSSTLNAFTNGKGDAGSITVRATDSVSLTNGSAFGSAVLDRGVGKGGDITIEAGSLSVTDGAQLVAVTRGFGDAGNIQINATDSVSVFGTSLITGSSSALFTSNVPGSTGFGGDITVNTSIFLVSDGAVLDARTTNDRRGGDITVNARRVSAINGGQLLTTTSGAGSAGKITVNATDSIIVNGSDPTFNDRVAQFGTAVANPEAASGLFVRSDGLGSAGDIEVTSPKILLDNFGRFIAESASGNGGNINLLGDLLLLRRGSQISTNAGTELFGGDGGNININSKFIVAIPQENSDITANAYTGTGGRVQINSQGILGIQSRPQLTDLSDITASSTLGIAGVIDINTDVTDALQNNLNQLPENIIDANALIANSCIARRNNSPGGTFLITGNDGLRERPGEATLSPYSTGTIRSIPNEGDLATSPTSTSDRRAKKINTPIVEAQGIYRLANGDLVLSRECP